MKLHVAVMNQTNLPGKACVSVYSCMSVSRRQGIDPEPGQALIFKGHKTRHYIFIYCTKVKFASPAVGGNLFNVPNAAPAGAGRQTEECEAPTRPSGGAHTKGPIVYTSLSRSERESAVNRKRRTLR
jgi:hypothetical protein